LANNIHTENSLWDAFVLDLRGMLETAINNGSEAFGLENEILETGRVDSYIVTPDGGVIRGK
jgi:hypothetical protein